MQGTVLFLPIPIYLLINSFLYCTCSDFEEYYSLWGQKKIIHRTGTTEQQILLVICLDVWGRWDIVKIHYVLDASSYRLQKAAVNFCD